MQTKKLFHHSTIYAIGNIIRQLVGFAMLPIYTQYLTPADYGVVGLLIFIISVVEGLFGARLGEATPKFYFEQKSQGKKDSVISTAMLVSGAVSVLVSIILILFGNALSELVFKTTEYSLIIGLFGAQVLTNALESQSLIFIRIQQRPLLFISFSLLKLALQLSLNIYFIVYLELGILGVAIGSISAAVTISLILTIYSFYHTKLRFDGEIAKRMIRFSWPLWLSGLASLYVSSANRYYIHLFSSLDNLGLFELASRFGFVITSLVYRPFAAYWDTERFNIYDQKNAKEIYQNVFTLVCLLLTISALFISIFSDSAIKLMSSPAFHSAAIAVPLLTLGGFARCLTDFCNFSFYITEKTMWINKIYYLMAIVLTIFYLLLIPRYGFVGAAAGAMLGEIVQFLIIYFIARKQYDMQLSLLPLVAMIPLASIGYLLTNHVFVHPHLAIDIAMKLSIFAFFSFALACYVLFATPAIQGLFPKVAQLIHRKTRH